MKKICSKCGVEKPLSDFFKRNERPLGVRSDCKLCYNASQKDRKRNREVANKFAKQERLNKRQYVINYLLEHPCVACSEPDPIVLEFHHVDSTTKINAISTLAGRSGSIVALQREIDKCEVLCSNCHKRRTAKERNYYDGICFWSKAKTC